MRKASTIIFIIAFAIVSTGFGQVQKPEDLKFPPLKYDPPHPKDFKVKLSNGMTGYIQENHSLPLVEIRAYIKYGSIYDPGKQLGIGDVLSGTLIKGGTRTKEGGDTHEFIDSKGSNSQYFRR